MSGEGGALVAALVSMGGLALLAPVLDRRLGRDTGYVLAVGFLGVAALLAPAASTALDGGAATFSRTWIDSLGVSFTLRMDGLATLFCVLVLGVGALIMAYCPRYLRTGEAHGRTYLLLTLFGGAMLGLVLAGDLLLLFVFWEMTTVTSFFLIGTGGAKAVKPAVRALLVTGMGGLALLAALVLLGIAAGSTDLADVLAAREEVLGSPLSPAIAALLILAAFTKSAQVPFQFWLPGAMAAITPVSAYLHAATMVKAGVYLLLRFSALYSGQTGWVIALMGVGLLTAVLGAAQALREHDLKALLAYSTVSQLGLLVAAIGVGTTVALAAAILHTFAHALFKATLFMIVGVIDRQAGSRDIRELSGLMRVMPVTATLAGLAGLSMAGVPPLIGFVSKESLFQGFVSADVFPGAGVVAGALAVTASVLTFAYGLRIFYGAFAGPMLQRLHEPSWAFVAPAAVAAAAGAMLGPGVEVLDPLMRQAVLDAEPWAVPPYFAFWHGFSPELLLSAVTIVSGLALFSARERVDRMLRRLPRPDGAAVFDRAYSTVLAAGAAVGRPDRSDSAAVFLARPLAGLVALGCAGVFAAGGPGIRAGAPSEPLDWGVLVLLAAAVAALARTGSALAAVALLGAVGLIVAVWFLLAGAPDVALTLLLVEVLTAMTAAFVLSDLSPRLPRPGGGALAAALAGLVGLVAALGTLALTGRRDLSPAGAYFLRAAEPETGGHNVVNTILVDFRGLDTLGEASVLAAAALGLLLLLPGPPAGAAGGRAEAPYGRLLAPARRLLVPGIAALSAYLFLRGHNQPGGGFSAALVAGAAVAFGHLAGRTGTRDARCLRPRPLLAAGLLLGAAVGLAAMALGDPFLTPFTVPVPGGGFSSSLLFDAAVYLMVLGLMVTLVDRLGAGGAGHR